jgi:hypothetical protein
MTKKLLFILLVQVTILFAYDKGKIDTHGGKGASLSSKSNFSNNFTLGSTLQKKKKEEVPKTKTTKKSKLNKN